ncbi:PAS domain S-box protein [candidate division KSB1 bacterium]|nr:PAS domain S-box protein [candidate division KSB1 bacterium]
MHLSRKICLLYMEDDPGIANLCKKYLERKDYTVTIAPDGKKGLELYKKRAFDVILVDHDLPVYSGLEVIRKLKEYDDVPPVIMITGQGSESLAVEAMKLGASDYLIKDVEGRYLDKLPGVIGKIVYEKLLLESKLEAEKTVLDNERKIKNVLNTIVDGVATINRNGIIDSVNPAVEKLFGYSSEELIGKNVKILMPEPYFQGHDNYLSQYQKTGEKQIIGIGREVQGKRKDGTIFPLYLAVSETEINNEKMYTGILHDITEQKEAEDKIKRLKTGIDQAYDAVMITDLDGSIHYVNPAFETMTGYTKDEVLGKNPRFLKSGKHSDEFYKDLWNTINKGKIWKSSIKNKRKDGTLYDEEISIAPVKNDNGDVVNFIAVKRDISERIKLEKEIENLKNEYEGFLRHELNNMLSPIKIYNDSLLYFNNNELSEKQLSLIRKIDYQIDKIVDLVNRIKDVQEFEFGNYELQLEKGDLSSVIKNVLWEYHKFAKNSFCFIFSSSIFSKLNL